MISKNWARRSAVASLLVLMSSVAVCVAMVANPSPELRIDDDPAVPPIVDRDLTALKTLLDKNPVDADDAEDAVQRIDDLILDTKSSAGLDATADCSESPKPDA